MIKIRAAAAKIKLCQQIFVNICLQSRHSNIIVIAVVLYDICRSALFILLPHFYRITPFVWKSISSAICYCSHTSHIWVLTLVVVVQSHKTYLQLCKIYREISCGRSRLNAQPDVLDEAGCTISHLTTFSLRCFRAFVEVYLDLYSVIWRKMVYRHRECETEGSLSRSSQKNAVVQPHQIPLLRDGKCKLLQKYIFCMVKMQQQVIQLLPGIMKHWSYHRGSWRC